MMYRKLASLFGYPLRVLYWFTRSPEFSFRFVVIYEEKESYHPWEDAWNPETQQYEFPWGNVNANDYNFGDFAGLHDPHNHHPQNPEVPEDWMGGPLVAGYPYYDADEMMMMYYD